MKIRKAKMMFVVMAVVGLSLTVVADGVGREVPEVLDGISQNSPLDARMCYQRGLRLYRGKECDRDLPAAVEAFRQAAEMEYAEAEDMLATCYHNGHGVQKDMNLAVAWRERAANHGHAYAMFMMGVYRHSGMGGGSQCIRGLLLVQDGGAAWRGRSEF